MLKERIIDESIQCLQEEGLRFSVDSLAKRLKISKKDELPVLFLPGVSLVFTGIAAATLSGIDPALATIVQGTIVAAAIINEVIAVIIAKFAFQWAGEIAK